jgi:hypothetical protein
MRRHGYLTAAVAALAIGCKRSPSVSTVSHSPLDSTKAASQPAPATPPGDFAYADSSGTRLLATGSLSDPTKIRGAICSGGLVLPVRYDRRQGHSKKDTGRQIASNFDNDGGDVFSLVRGEARPDETCYLSADSSLLAGAVSVTDLGSSACLPAQLTRLAAARERQVIHCWRLAKTHSNNEIIAAQYVAIDTNALASLVIMRDSALLWQDFPGVLREDSNSVWRVDDEGRFDPHSFEILFVAEFPHAYAIAIAWGGAEGESDTFLLADSTSAFRTVVQGYRYEVPD